MRAIPTLLAKFGAASVAGLITLGGGLAFAEGEGATEPAPTEDGIVVAPVEAGTGSGSDSDGSSEATPIEQPVIQEGTSTDETTTEEQPVQVIIEQPVEVIEETPSEVVVEEPVEHVRKENHGKHVSEAARTAPKGKGGVHGKAVSEVARSDAGKKHAAPAPEEGGSAEAAKPSKGHGKK